MDNLNTHAGASLYEAFEPQEARRLFDRLEIHYTPKHGSWLNIAEIELRILNGQCLKRRIPDKGTYYQVKLLHGKRSEILIKPKLTGSLLLKMQG